MFRLYTAIILLAAFFLAPAETVLGGDGKIVYSFHANAGPLNPHLYSPNQMYAQEMLYEPLVRLAADGGIEPCLAERWEVSMDGRSILFHLREGVFFTDGTPFDASAAVENFRAVMANERRHAWLGLTEKIAGYSAPSPATFRLDLKEAYEPALRDLALPRPFRFLSPAAFAADGTTHNGIASPVGTGPWKLAESILGVRDVFVRNDGYWGDKPMLDRVEVAVIPDPVSRAMALRTGEIDLVYGEGQINFDMFAGFRSDPGFETAVSPPVGTESIAIHTGKGPTRELAVRRALQHLTDKEAIAGGIFLGVRSVADTLFAPDVPYAGISGTPYDHDPEKARRLLGDAGWKLAPGQTVRAKDGVPLVIDFCFIGNDAAHKAVAEVLQGQFARGGVLLNLVGEEEDSYLRRQRDGAFGMIMNPTWGPPFEPHAMLSSMRTPSHADYEAQSGLTMKDELHADITRALGEMDGEKRAVLYRRIQDTLHEEAVYLPLNYVTVPTVFRAGVVKNFSFAPGKFRIPFERFGK